MGGVCETSCEWAAGASVALEIGGAYCLRMFYNQPNFCKGLKVCMNGRFFSCRWANEQCENSWRGLRIGDPRGPKNGGSGAAQ